MAWFNCDFLDNKSCLNEGINFGLAVNYSNGARDAQRLANIRDCFANNETKLESNASPASPHGSTQSGGTLAILRNWRLLFWIIVIILTPLMALSVIELTLGASGVLNLPSWMRELGIVSEEQGRLALVASATIFLTIGLLVYAVLWRRRKLFLVMAKATDDHESLTRFA